MKPLLGVMFSPSPARIPERIGIIGRTHGVKDSNKPATKKVRITVNMLALETRDARRDCSEILISPDVVF
jgi:hypothetical protein